MLEARGSRRGGEELGQDARIGPTGCLDGGRWTDAPGQVGWLDGWLERGDKEVDLIGLESTKGLGQRGDGQESKAAREGGARACRLSDKGEGVDED